MIATAVLGSIGTRPRSRWYRELDKPPWQPPDSAFGPVWTSIYALTAVSAARTLARISRPERTGYVAVLATNLALNAAYPWCYFAARNQRLGLAVEIAIEATTLDLARRTWPTDRPAMTMLAPYASWNAFAIGLTVAILRRNPHH